MVPSSFSHLSSFCAPARSSPPSGLKLFSQLINIPSLVPRRHGVSTRAALDGQARPYYLGQAVQIHNPGLGGGALVFCAPAAVGRRRCQVAMSDRARLRPSSSPPGSAHSPAGAWAAHALGDRAPGSSSSAVARGPAGNARREADDAAGNARRSPSRRTRPPPM